MKNIAEIIKTDNKYDLKLFSQERVDFLESQLVEKDGKYYLRCLIRNKDILAKPEEIVRQLFIDKLLNEYSYPKELINLEQTIYFGREKKYADIVVLSKKDKRNEYIIIEVKKHKEKDGLEQLRSYTNATGAPLAVWTNGSKIQYFLRLKPNILKPLRDIPKESETIEDVESREFTYLDLMKNDKLEKEKRNLRDLIKLMEDEVLANAGVDVFEEVFKLIFTKLYDEMESSADREDIEKEIKKRKKNSPDLNEREIIKELSNDMLEDRRNLEFRSRGDSGRTKDVISTLFENAKKRWQGIFDIGEPIRIFDENHLDTCVAFLEEVKLFNSNLQVVDEAFEYLVNKSSKGEKGQYFTPRNVIDMCVKMLNPKFEEYMIDTAAGSCGFTVHTIFKVWDELRKNDKANSSNFSNRELTKEQKEYVQRVFGIDFDEKSVRVAKTLNLIAGDGKTNVLHMNTLDFDSWGSKVYDRDWRRIYGNGFDNLMDLKKEKNSEKEFMFDIVMANPPFAGDIKDSRIIYKYDLGYKDNGKAVGKISRDILFVERNLDMLKPGGRMAIVLPQGRFNNTSDQKVREYILERCRLIAVVGLDGNTFKPHTGTKTSVLFVQKWDDKLCPRVEDYPIFFAVSEKSGKDNSGDYVYLKNEKGERILDSHGHLVIDHDLYNHEGLLGEGIAEEFAKWAKENNLSFWR
jgi:type I restriction enzyme M protein